MTAAVPHSPRADNCMRSSIDANETGNQHGPRLPAVSIALGALSVATFWVVALGAGPYDVTDSGEVSASARYGGL